MNIVQQEVDKFFDHIFSNRTPIYHFTHQCLHNDAQKAKSHLGITFKGIPLFWEEKIQEIQFGMSGENEAFLASKSQNIRHC